MLLYHTGYQEIREPDVHFGRKNADFGQGFYLTGDEEFSRRWAKRRKNADPCINSYELDLAGLSVHRFVRDEAWFDYIFGNRAGRVDTLPDVDVVVGPIANDTIYNTFGVTTSGVLGRDLSLQLLLIGPVYEQIVLKTESAAAQLRWLSSRTLDSAETDRYREAVRQEEAEYQRLFSETLESMTTR